MHTINKLDTIDLSSSDNPLEEFLMKRHEYNKNSKMSKSDNIINLFTPNKPFVLIGQKNVQNFESNDLEHLHEYKINHPKNIISFIDSAVMMTIYSNDHKELFKTIHSIIEKEIKKRVRHKIETESNDRIWDESREGTGGYNLHVQKHEIAAFSQTYYNQDSGGDFLVYLKIYQNPKTFKRMKSLYGERNDPQFDGFGIKNFAPGLSIKSEDILNTIYNKMKDSLVI